jgi:hypothetical protein
MLQARRVMQKWRPSVAAHKRPFAKQVAAAGVCSVLMFGGVADLRVTIETRSDGARIEVTAHLT